MNLGLAHANAGHGIAAIYWLKAYLVALPEAANAAAVRQTIAQLRPSEDAKTAKLLDVAHQAAERFPQGKDRDWAIDAVSREEADFYGRPARDINKALRLRPGSVSATWRDYAGTLAATGDIDGALGLISKIDKADDRDDVRVMVADMLFGDGHEDRARQILGTCEDPDKAIGWRFERALKDGKSAEAEALVDKASRKLTRDKLLDQLVKFYVNIWTRPPIELAKRQDLAYRALQKISDAEKRAGSAVWLAGFYIEVGDVAAAQRIATEGSGSLPNYEVPIFLHATLGHNDFLSKTRHGPPYFGALIAFNVSSGRLDEARRLQAAALRELSGNELDKWKKEDTGTSVFALNLRMRVGALWLQGRSQAAKELAGALPVLSCGKDVAAENVVTDLVAPLGTMALAEVERGDLAAATRTLAAIPRIKPAATLAERCTLQRGDVLRALAKAHLDAGRREEATAVVAEAAALVWNGALIGFHLRELAAFYDRLDDGDAAAHLRDLLKFEHLHVWVSRAVQLSARPAVIDLGGEVRRITAQSSSRFPGMREQATAQDRLSALVDLAYHLAHYIDEYDTYHYLTSRPRTP